MAHYHASVREGSRAWSVWGTAKTMVHIGEALKVLPSTTLGVRIDRCECESGERFVLGADMGLLVNPHKEGAHVGFDRPGVT